MPSAFGFRPLMRMRRQRDFERAYRHGSRARGSELLVIAVVNGLAHSRLGLSVGRKVWKNAVRRNRVRRVFREAFRLSYPSLPPGHDFVMIPAEPRLEPRLEPVSEELLRLAHKAVRRQAEKRAAQGGEKGAPESSGETG